MTVLLSDDDARAQARSLYRARRDGVPIPPLTDAWPGLGMLDGYAVQQHLVRLLVDDGEVVAGYKLGLTSLAMQELLGVDSPDFGPVFASGVLGDGALIVPGRFIAPRIEAEIGVLLDRDLAGPGCTSARALACTRGLVAALEIVDSRIEGWRIKLADTVADLASGGAIALSGLVVPVSGFDPRLVGMVLTRNGEVVATGAGAAALGDPLAAVAWLANTLAPMGVVLPAGSIVMTGALHAMVAVAPGDVFRADFDRLGPVTVAMAAESATGA
ncbi:MAG: 2-keto-4-pentenoate hydratase [Candidatus Nanopelagicales bacterium]